MIRENYWRFGVGPSPPLEAYPRASSSCISNRPGILSIEGWPHEWGGGFSLQSDLWLKTEDEKDTEYGVP